MITVPPEQTRPKWYAETDAHMGGPAILLHPASGGHVTASSSLQASISNWQHTSFLSNPGTLWQFKDLSWWPIYVTLKILISSGSSLTRQPSGDPLPRASRFVWPELHWSCSLRWPLRLAAWLRLQRGRMVGSGVEDSQCVFIASPIVTCTNSYLYDPETCHTAVPVCGRDASFTWRTSVYPSWLGVDPADHSGTGRALQVPKNFLRFSRKKLLTSHNWHW